MAYTATTPNATDTITATPEDPGAQVEIDLNGASVTNGDTVLWAVGLNHLTIQVVNGDNLKIYNVAVTYTPPAPPDARLSGLTIGSLALTPTFDPDVQTYTVDTTNTRNTVTATAMDSSCSIDLALDGSPVDNGTQVTWEDGANTLTITVAGGDGSTTYTVTVTKS